MKTSKINKDYKANTFSEVGIDPDNNRFLLGISSEVEFEDGSEIRYKKWLRVDKVLWFYFRFWVLNRVFGVSINVDKSTRERKGLISFRTVKKNRNNLKIIIGRAGISPEPLKKQSKSRTS